MTTATADRPLYLTLRWIDLDGQDSGGVDLVGPPVVDGRIRWDHTRNRLRLRPGCWAVVWEGPQAIAEFHFYETMKDWAGFEMGLIRDGDRSQVLCRWLSRLPLTEAPAASEAPSRPAVEAEPPPAVEHEHTGPVWITKTGLSRHQSKSIGRSLCGRVVHPAAVPEIAAAWRPCSRCSASAAMTQQVAALRKTVGLPSETSPKASSMPTPKAGPPMPTIRLPTGLPHHIRRVRELSYAAGLPPPENLEAISDPALVLLIRHLERTLVTNPA